MNASNRSAICAASIVNELILVLFRSCSVRGLLVENVAARQGGIDDR